jgi:hypothetical protein
LGETTKEIPDMKAQAIVNDVEYSSRANSYRAEFDPDNGPSVTIVGLVCSALERSVTDLPPFNEAIDPDALDALFGSDDGGRPGSRQVLEFDYADCLVRVENEGHVVVVPRNSSPTIN